uniref:Uncharacterized protein n=1 Tax=Candidatus Kentrum sp. DK TaxID=2126562 RepID=A0A450TKQ0_9GAMM|nr:MAG: hypothetical protein BECKDK2373B_GA0170837_12094 [Candidatus Kentron sp. DK]VFJ69619.1 MAG: hypothetical protein BECKDK2373C_GA0170839_12253 [Candidatus Kentron sp. DK]
MTEIFSDHSQQASLGMHSRQALLGSHLWMMVNL